MARINIVTAESANPEQRALYHAINAQLGMVPNFLKVFANSPAALKAFLGLHGIAGDGSLDPQTRERIALALAALVHLECRVIPIRVLFSYSIIAPTGRQPTSGNVGQLLYSISPGQAQRRRLSRSRPPAPSRSTDAGSGMISR